MGQPIRILLVDDHSLFRDSLSRLLQAEPDFRIVGTCASATEALPVLDREHPDIVLLDFDLGEEQGLQFLDESKKRGFRGRILMVTAGMSDAAVAKVSAPTRKCTERIRSGITAAGSSRSCVAGQRTVGKGSIQTQVPLGAPGAFLKLTSGEFLRPSGKCLQRAAGAGLADDWGVRATPGAGKVVWFTLTPE